MFRRGLRIKQGQRGWDTRWCAREGEEVRLVEEKGGEQVNEGEGIMGGRGREHTGGVRRNMRGSFKAMMPLM